MCRSSHNCCIAFKFSEKNRNTAPHRISYFSQIIGKSPFDIYFKYTFYIIVFYDYLFCFYSCQIFEVDLNKILILAFIPSRYTEHALESLRHVTTQLRSINKTWLSI